MINSIIPIVSLILNALFVPLLLPMLAFAILVCLFSIIRRFLTV